MGQTAWPDKIARVANRGLARHLVAARPDESQPTAESRAEPATVVCSQCAAIGACHLRFCTKCGQGLWQVCPTCGASSLAGEAFCGNCGSNLANVRRTQLERFDAVLQQVAAFEAEERFDAAAELIEKLTLGEYKHLAREQMARVKPVQDRCCCGTMRSTRVPQRPWLHHVPRSRGPMCSTRRLHLVDDVAVRGRPANSPGAGSFPFPGPSRCLRRGTSRDLSDRSRRFVATIRLC